MTRASRLRPVPGSKDNMVEPMKRKDPITEILEAFATDNPADDLALGEQDKLYSQAMSEGLVSEEEINSSFEAFLDREVHRDPETGELHLSGAALPALGERLRSYRTLRSMTVEQLARDNQLTISQIEQLERTEEPFDPDRVAELSKALATEVGASPVRVHTLLQAVRATAELKATRGPTLLAARRAPPK
jgi:transcriptional regulator with XRE-family HTH domain